MTLSTGETVRTTGGEPKKAELEYRVITSKDMATLLEIHLLTGRFHQIRAQLSHLGHPILGDSRYANSDSEQYSAARSIDNVCLAAFSFSLKHPTSGKRLTFKISPHNKHISELLAECDQET